jgi:hypothetical protein
MGKMGGEVEDTGREEEILFLSLSLSLSVTAPAN